jgi:cell division protein ZapA
MAEVTISIQGKAYKIACDDGQEKRLSALGKYVDARLRDIAKSGAASSEAHLLVLTSIVLADEVDELRAALEAAGTPKTIVRETEQRVSEDDEREIIEAINHLATRIDSVASRLHKIQ